MNTSRHRRVNLPVESKLRRERARKRRQASVQDKLFRGEMALKLGQPEVAASEARGVLERDPSHLGALELLTKAAWRQGRFEEVLTGTSRLLSLNPYEPGYHGLRGAALQSMGRYGEAMEAFERCAGMPESSEALEELQAWQAGLIGELLATDAVFRACYAQDPAKACESRGFRFLPNQTTTHWTPATQVREWTYTRPS